MKKLCMLMCVLIPVLVFVSCGGKAGDLESIKKRGEIVLYTDPSWPPFEYVGPAGETIGVDIDIANRIADDIGVKLRVVNGEFDAFPLALQNTQVDMGISGITITEDRKEALDFSIPYADLVQYIVKSISNTDIKNLNSLAGLRIGVQKGTTGDFWVDENIKNGVLKGSGAELVQFKTVQEAMLSMKKGDLSALVCDKPIANNLAAVNKEFNTVEASRADGTITNEEFGVAVKKGNKTLLDAINGTLKEMISNGDIAKSVEYHTANSALR
ncbi:MAG: transporter substrate-binding domain-containing protein [Spirochaetaceae bacterium]|jgi:polar amino acid transport system substrate-binding protein|nr:transporter substrate-binding domain-containing protein [Spirochaetaceae bacterium]